MRYNMAGMKLKLTKWIKEAAEWKGLGIFFKWIDWLGDLPQPTQCDLQIPTTPSSGRLLFSKADRKGAFAAWSKNVPFCNNITNVLYILPNIMFPIKHTSHQNILMYNNILQIEVLCFYFPLYSHSLKEKMISCGDPLKGCKSPKNWNFIKHTKK